MTGYVGWNEALCDWFFRPDLAGQPAYLCCDASVPAAVAQWQGWSLIDPLADLLSAVRPRVGAPEPLDPWVQEAIRWRKAGSIGTPPWVAVLAVTVLAACVGDESDGDLTVHDGAYYRPLRQLLGMPAGARPSAFDNDVQMLWTFLREWLEDHLHGARGRPTASASRRLPNVGWALSQTLLSAAERTRLPEFFRAIGAGPGEDVAPWVLLACYVRWAPRHGGQAARIAAGDRESPVAALVAGVLHQSLLAWDGRYSRDERGRTTLPLLLAYHSGRGLLRLVTRTPAGMSGWTLTLDDGEVRLGVPQELVLLAGDAAAALAGRSVIGRLGPEEAAGHDVPVDLQMRLSRQDVHVLVSNVELAMWVEAGTASFGRQHVVIARDHLARAVETAMTDLGGSHTVRLTRIRLPAGWLAYQKFEPTCLAELPENLTALLPSGVQLAHLSGGLPIDVRSRVWLTSGPPDVVLPDIAGTPVGTLRLDHLVLPWPADGRLRLHEHALAAGTHELAVAGRNLGFALVDEAVDQNGRGDVRLTVDRRPVKHTFNSSLAATAGLSGPAASTPVPIEVTVCGASVSAASRDDRLLAPPVRPQIQLGGRYYALGTPGQAARLHPVAPAWLGQLRPPLYPRDADLQTALAEVGFRPHWLLHVPAQGPRTVMSLQGLDHATHPAQGGPPHSGAGDWRRVVRDLDLAEVPADQQPAWQAWLDQDNAPAAPPASMAGRRA